MQNAQTTISKIGVSDLTFICFCDKVVSVRKETEFCGLLGVATHTEAKCHCILTSE